MLFAGVLSRYVFRAPLIWSDELASILFLWLTMLGAVLALHRGTHMRLTAFTARLPRWVPLLSALSTVLTAVFLIRFYYLSRVA